MAFGTIVCEACGAPVSADSQTCPYCGNPVKVEPTVAAPAAQAAQSEAPAPVATPECAVSVYEHNINAVCEIDAFNAQGIGGSGTGFLINDDGILLTNVHVATVNNIAATDITVTVAGESVKAKVLELGDNKGGDGGGIDVAVLKLTRIPKKATHVTVGASKDIKHGENIYYIGNSLGEGLCITRGIISDPKRDTGHGVRIMTDAATNPGNSGGPLFNEAGEVIGIHVSARANAVGMKYAIPIDDAKKRFPKYF